MLYIVYVIEQGQMYEVAAYTNNLSKAQSTSDRLGGGYYGLKIVS